MIYASGPMSSEQDRALAKARYKEVISLFPHLEKHAVKIDDGPNGEAYFVWDDDAIFFEIEALNGEAEFFYRDRKADRSDLVTELDDGCEEILRRLHASEEA